MRIEPKAAFYNEETGAVQPWKDIEVTDSVGNALVSEGLAIAIAEGGGGGGGDYKTANVTIIGDNGGEAWSFSITASQDDDGLALCAFDIDGNFALNLNTDGAPTTAKVVYTGESALVAPYNNVGSVTGDAVYDGDTNTITITGDCTITGYMDD